MVDIHTKKKTVEEVAVAENQIISNEEHLTLYQEQDILKKVSILKFEV